MRLIVISTVQPCTIYHRQRYIASS